MEAIGSFGMYEGVVVSLGGMVCVYLGYRLLLLGINHPFKIFSDLSGWRFKVANVTPGVLFAILGTVVLCFPITANIVAILQKQTFINSYATKLILDELYNRNEQLLHHRIRNNLSVVKSAPGISPSTVKLSTISPRKLDRAKVTSNVLRVRKQPGTRYRIIGALRKGDIIAVKETRGLWLRVSTDKFADGWVHGNYVTRLEDYRSNDSAGSPLLLSSNP
ncbi:MAG: SH3 domain-containing protein [Deltaproteobacteria bacterium]|nr:MAG: SH3 domain-containing protein [Deltaproteobacteria bacterium]